MPDRVQTPEQRHEAILRLLAHRYEMILDGGEDLPTMRQAKASTATGFVHRTDHHAACPDCFGDLPARNGCETCRGRGYLVERRHRDPYAVNVVQRLAGHTGDRHEQRRALDAAIDRASVAARDRPTSSADEIAEAERRDYGWARWRERMYARYDFAALEQAVERLRLTMPDTPPGSRVGVQFMGLYMPAYVRAPEPEPRPAQPVFGSSKERNRRIRELILRDGLPTQWVAAHVGLSVSQVNRIVANRDEEAA